MVNFDTGLLSQAGGRITHVDTETETIVHIHVPEQASAQRTSSPADEGTSDSRGTLLIVDDNESARILATRMLTKAGFEVLTATDGVEALAVLRGRSVDCLMTDIAMPGMGGLDLAERARSVDPGMPVVFVSGFVSVPRGPGGPLPDNAHSVTKPYTAEALVSAVHRAIRCGRPKLGTPAK
jgi:two-component system, cell cycle sensor histidine kinase and response regulator CckA